MERVEANDPAELSLMGTERYNEGDYDAAVEYWKKAAELGDMEAHYRLGRKYFEGGHGVEKDAEKAVYHWEKAAIGGHPLARVYLAAFGHHGKYGGVEVERVAEHLIIAANLGCDEAMKGVWALYSKGGVTKEDLEATLRTHQAAIDATKSSQRDAATKFLMDETL